MYNSGNGEAAPHLQKLLYNKEGSAVSCRLYRKHRICEKAQKESENSSEMPARLEEFSFALYIKKKIEKHMECQGCKGIFA